MKKVLIFLGCVAAIIVFALRGCQAEIGEPSEIIPSVTDEITLTITDATATKAAYVITNNAAKELVFGYGSILEKYQDGIWYSLVYKEDVAYPGVAMTIQAGQQKEETTSWRRHHGILNSGKYRLIKAVSDGNYDYLLSAEFELN